MSTRIPGALAGTAAGALTLGVAELLSVVMSRTDASSGTPSPLLAVGGAFVDLTPAWLKDLAVATFGTNDKIALFVGMGFTLLMLCAALGVLSVRRLSLGLTLFGVVGLVGVLAVLSRPESASLDPLPTAVGVAVGLVVLRWLAARAASLVGTSQPRTDDGGVVAGSSAGSSASSPEATRRRVLAWGGGLTVVGAIGTYVGRTFNEAGEAVQVARAQVSERLAAARSQVPEVSIPADADFELPGLASYVSPNDDFYRIDTALSVPQLRPDDWSLRVHGMVDEEIELSLDELLDQDLIDTVVTLCCVSNPVGGDLIGNAVWTGWPIRELLARAGVSPEADMVLSTSSDGFTAGTPLEALTDDRDSIFAVLMNGEPLPAQHGFPVRMVVPGLYGYVSATKWVVSLKVTRFDSDQGYWTPRGWSALGPIKVQSRIDVPTSGASLGEGSTVIAGVAWDQHTGVEKVEVRVDDGDWMEADLSGEVSIDTWRQWRLDWDAPAGDHTIAVRATNADGETQTEETAPVAPDGATGWHTIDVTAG
ncbi:MAG: molybdopterin-dependent oxidoreductase [Ornithinimicrobium sp.]